MLGGVEETADGLFLRAHVATLVNGVLPIPSELQTVVMEIGASDRNTLDVEYLPQDKGAFLVTAEPIIDKYARALARQRGWSGDKFQPLGHHHPRGLVLPVAVGPARLAGVQQFHVGLNAGCSSVLKVDAASDRLKYCGRTLERRQGPVITLERLLRLVNRTVEFVKVDAQGLDLDVLRSAAANIRMVRRFGLEVVVDDCNGLYVGQPKCSEVVRQAGELGFRPAAPFPCLPRWPREAVALNQSSAGCEMEILFVADGVGAGPFWGFHQPHLNGCRGHYRWNETLKLVQRPPPGAPARW